MNNDSAQLYNHVPNQPPPFVAQLNIPNQSVSLAAQSISTDIVETSGLFSSSMGDNPNLQSGVAIEQLQERGDTGTLEYFEALEVAVEHTARIIVDAIPSVYDTQRQVRILGEDGAFESTDINRVEIDMQTGQPVVLNDLSTGRYNVSCEVGKSFQSRQQESVAAIIEMAQIDPTVVQQGGDILLKNTNAPGLDLIAERKRQELFNAGLIPESQWTDEEREQAMIAQQQAAQNPQPDPIAMAAQAEMEKAKADQMEVERKAMESEKANQIKIAELQLKQRELEIKQLDNQSDAEIQVMKNKIEEYKVQIEAAKAGAQVQNIEVDTAKTLKEIQAMDVESLAALASGLQVGGSANEG